MENLGSIPQEEYLHQWVEKDGSFALGLVARSIFVGLLVEVLARYRVSGMSVDKVASLANLSRAKVRTVVEGSAGADDAEAVEFTDIVKIALAIGLLPEITLHSIGHLEEVAHQIIDKGSCAFVHVAK